MSQFLSNKYLKYRAAMHGEPITGDRLCDQCDYNLRGLRIGGRCPECGAAIQLDNPAHDALADAPVRVIRGLRNGFWLMVPAIVLVSGLPMMVVPAIQGYAAAFMVIAAALWAGGVWFITNPIATDRGKKYGFDKHSKLRIATRWCNVAWFGAQSIMALLIIVVPFIGAGANVLLGGLLGLLSLAGLAGIVLLTILLGRLADWCYDESAGKLLTWAMWALPIGTVVLASPLVLRQFALFVCGGTLLWISGLVSLGLAVAILARSVTWSLKHAMERADRNRALTERHFDQQATLRPRVETDG